MERKDPGRGIGTTGDEPGRPRAARTLRSFREPDVTPWSRDEGQESGSLSCFSFLFNYVFAEGERGSQGPPTSLRANVCGLGPSGKAH